MTQKSRAARRDRGRDDRSEASGRRRRLTARPLEVKGVASDLISTLGSNTVSEHHNAPPQSMTRFCESAARLGRWASALSSRRSEGRLQQPHDRSGRRGRKEPIRRYRHPILMSSSSGAQDCVRANACPDESRRRLSQRGREARKKPAPIERSNRRRSSFGTARNGR